MNLFDRLINRLRLTRANDDVFVGGAGAGGVTENARLFGGLVAAQATMAASRTVTEFPLHSLHAYFLRPGRAETDIEYRVSRAKDGKNFAVRNVAAVQRGELIFQLQASFQRTGQGVAHQTPAPEVPAPHRLPNRDQLRGRANWQDMPLEVRMVTPMTGTKPLPAEQQLWLRANGELPDDEDVHLAMIVYASDRSLLDTAWRPHADQGNLVGASLDHSMWFHERPRFDDWLLYSMQSPAAAGGRGLAFGAMYDLRGRRVVSIAQEGVLRVSPR